MFTTLLKGIAGRQPRTRIAFERTGDHVPGRPRGLYTINPDGSDCCHIRPTGEAPRWSPDGKWIAFVEGTKDNGGLQSVFVMRPTGEDVRRLTFHHDVTATPPCWSPDATRLAYSLWLWHESRSELCVVELATGEWKHVVYTEDQIYPVWSPSDKIIFSLYGGASVSRLFEVDPKGQHFQQCAMFQPGDSEPIWTNDGTRVVYGRSAGLVIMAADGGHVQTIHPKRAAIQWAIAPDGQKVAYTCQGAGDAGFEVFVADLNRQSTSKIVSNPIADDHEVDSRYVSWSPPL